MAVVTGASSGIGAATVAVLESAGFLALGAARTKRGRCDFLMDVSDEESVRSTFALVISRYGRFDLLVNNAGCVSQSPMEDCSLDEWNQVLSTNLTGAFLCSKHAVRHFLQASGGVIVNVSSIAGRSCSPTASEAYTCSKYGIIGLTKQLAARYGGRNIRVNCVCPSQTLTPLLTNALSEEKIADLGRQNPMSRLAHPEEVAEAISFLASDKAAYINGAILDVNGGKL